MITHLQLTFLQTPLPPVERTRHGVPGTPGTPQAHCRNMKGIPTGDSFKSNGFA